MVDPVEDDAPVGFIYSARVLPVLLLAISAPLPTRDTVDHPLEATAGELVAHVFVLFDAGVSRDSTSTGTTNPSPL